VTLYYKERFGDEPPKSNLEVRVASLEEKVDEANSRIFDTVLSEAIEEGDVVFMWDALDAGVFVGYYMYFHKSGSHFVYRTKDDYNEGHGVESWDNASKTNPLR
jgi:hypothetical protein